MTTKLLVLYYSSWGHLETMARGVADGARAVSANETAGARFQGAHVVTVAQALVCGREVAAALAASISPPAAREAQPVAP